MMIQAVLSNPSHPEYGVATIPFPIPRDQYAHCMELLAALEIGDAVKADCKVEEVDSFYTVLKRVEMLTVNVEELSYLAKRLDSFDTGEAAQFQAMAHKLELFELKDLINLTFCCQQATVITDFSDLAAVGRDHYMNLHGGSASVDELNKLDGEGTARQLIESGSGTITPYGVVYDNGMKLEQIYDGRFFPCYYYEPNAITVAATAKSEPEDTEHITWLFLPMEREEIDRALLRGGITDPADVRLRLESSQLPDEVDVLLDMEYETLADLNELAEATDGLSKADMEKLGAVVMLAEPKSAAQIKNLAESLDLFDFAPGAHTPQEYGKYMIRQSGHFEYDENLDAFYDYEKYGTERMNEEDGMFTDRGYRTADGQLCHYSKFNPEAYILLKIAPIRQENAWYRRTQEQPSSSSDEVMQAEREFFPLSIGYRGDMAFQNAEVIDVPKFLAGEIVSHKELTSSELWGLLFERTEVEMDAYMRRLDHLERDELIQSAEEISAMQVCRRGLMAERKKLTRRNVLFLLQVEKPLGMISEVWMEQQNAEEGNAFSRLLAELYKQKGNGYLIDDEQPETVKQMLESCPNNCFMLLMPQGILKLASDEAEKALRGEEYTVLLDYSGDSEPIKTADLLEMVVIDMRKDEQGCWYVLVVHPKLLEALRREKKMT